MFAVNLRAKPFTNDISPPNRFPTSTDIPSQTITISTSITNITSFMNNKCFECSSSEPYLSIPSSRPFLSQTFIRRYEEECTIINTTIPVYATSVIC